MREWENGRMGKVGLKLYRLHIESLKYLAIKNGEIEIEISNEDVETSFQPFKNKGIKKGKSCI